VIVGTMVVIFGTVVVVGSFGTVVLVGSFGSVVVVGSVGTCATAVPAKSPSPSPIARSAANFTPPQLHTTRFGCEPIRPARFGPMAVLKPDYYEVLGVSRDADEEAIKRAFHMLARQWHPDVADASDAEARFRELAEAYSVLSKREARLLYDRYGYRGRGNQGFDEALWEARPQSVTRGENVHLPLEIRNFEATEGTKRILNYEAAVRCKACMGRGSAGLPDPDCEVCGGSGRKRTVANLEVANLMQIEACSSCVGEPCSVCAGEGTVKAERRLRLLVPPGVENGAQLRVSGDGNDAGAGSIPGDLLIRVNVQPPPRDPRAVRYIAFALLVIAIATLLLYVLR
jgi:DnaJ-class molecular chaperone